MTGAAAVALLLLAAPSHARKAAPKAAYLEWIQLVELADGGLTADGRPVQAGYFAPAGARLELSPGARAVFRIGKEDAPQGAFELRGPATFGVHGGANPGLDLWRGKLLAALGGMKSRFAIHARGLLAAAQGNDFFMDMVGRSNLYLCACRGSVAVSDGRPRGYRRTVRGEAHVGVGYHLGGGATLETEHAQEGHTDEELEALQAIAAGR